MSTYETQPDRLTEAQFPALVGGVVTERHASICRERGHAKHAVDGKDTGRCPRCGAVTLPDTDQSVSYGIGWDIESGPAEIAPDTKLCRHCHGWGVTSVPYGGGVFTTEDCRHCAGTGEELNL